MIRSGRPAVDHHAADGQDSGEVGAKPSREVLAQGSDRRGSHFDRRDTGDFSKSGKQADGRHGSAERAEDGVTDLLGERRVVAVLGVAEGSPQQQSLRRPGHSVQKPCLLVVEEVIVPPVDDHERRR